MKNNTRRNHYIPSHYLIETETVDFLMLLLI